MDKTKSWLEKNSSANQKVETYGGQKKQGEGIWQQEQPLGEKIGSRDRTGREKGGVWCEEAGGNYWLLQQQHTWFGEKEGRTGSRGSLRKGKRSYKTLVYWTSSSVLPALQDQSWVFYTLQPGLFCSVHTDALFKKNKFIWPAPDQTKINFLHQPARDMLNCSSCNTLWISEDLGYWNAILL